MRRSGHIVAQSVVVHLCTTRFTQFGPELQAMTEGELVALGVPRPKARHLLLHAAGAGGAGAGPGQVAPAGGYRV